MREKEFMEMAKQEILRQLPEDVRNGLSLKEVEVVKINDQKNHGFCFLEVIIFLIILTLTVVPRIKVV